jgi:hypothetical protein
MNITNDDKMKLRHITNRYAQIHAEVRELEQKMLEIVDKKNVITSELYNLRDAEISLINKIEEDTGLTLTQDILTEIVNR